jgi:ATP-binding cassette, subfamily B, bacterial PglK
METFRKAIHLITRQDRMKLLVLVPLALIVTGVEVLGAGLVYAILGLATGASDDLALPLIGDVTRFVDLDDRGFLIGLVVIALVFFIGKSTLKLLQTFIQGRIVGRMSARVATRFMVGYLSMPYSFHLRRNSSELIRNITNAVHSVFNEVFSPMVKLIGEGLLAVGMLVVLFVVSPSTTLLAIGVLGVTAGVVMLAVQPRLRRLGRVKHELYKANLQSLQQAFHGVRDVKILGSEHAFAAQFQRDRRQLARAGYWTSTLNQIPGSAIEFALVGFILLVFGFATLVGQDTPQTLTILGLFAYAGQRLQNSTSVIVSAINNLRHAAAPIDDLSADLEQIQDVEAAVSSGPPLPFERELRVDKASFRYEAAHRDALSDVSLTIKKGEVIGICGPTGGGKTTLVDLMTGLLHPTTGTVTVDGLDLREHARAWHRNLGVVPQMVFLVDAPLRDNIALAARKGKVDEAALNGAVDLAQLREFVDSLPDGLDTVIGERGVRVSGGQRQRIAIARALYRRPSVLVFDEGTSALDNTTEREVMAALARLRDDHTILMVAHRLSTVRNADRIVLVQDGRIAAMGSYDELLETSPEFAVLAGT